MKIYIFSNVDEYPRFSRITWSIKSKLSFELFENLSILSSRASFVFTIIFKSSGVI